MRLKKLVSPTFVWAIIAAVICGGLYASISFDLTKASAERKARTRAAPMEEIRGQLAVIEDQLAQLEHDLLKAQTRPGLEQAEPGPVPPQVDKEKATCPPDSTADYGVALEWGTLQKEMERLQQKESSQAGLPAWGPRQFILSFLAGAGIGFGVVWLAAWFGRLRAINTRQKLVVAAGLAVIAAVTIYPPWVIRVEPRGTRETVIKKDAGHSFIWSPPHFSKGTHPCFRKPPYADRGALDLHRLSLQWVLVIGVAGGLFAAYADNGRRRHEPNHPANHNHLALTES